MGNIIAKAIGILTVFLLSTTIVAQGQTTISNYAKIDGCAGIQGYHISASFTGFCLGHYLRGKVAYSRYSIIIFAILYHGKLLGNVCFLNNYLPITGTYNISNSKQLMIFGLCHNFKCWAEAYL